MEGGACRDDGPRRAREPHESGREEPHHVVARVHRELVAGAGDGRRLRVARDASGPPDAAVSPLRVS